MTRRFVLVTATTQTKGTLAVPGAGIRKLKRGVSLPQFIVEYLNSIGVSETCYAILKREDTYTVILKSDDAQSSWNFTEYPEDEIFSAVAHLSREELLRDLKELLPLKANQ